MSIVDGIRFGIGHQIGRAFAPLVVVLILVLVSWAVVEVVAWAEGRAARARRDAANRLDNAPRPLPDVSPEFFAELWESMRDDPRVVSISYDYSDGPIVVSVRRNPGVAQTVPEVVRAAAWHYPIEILWHPHVFDPSEFDALTAEGD